MEHVVIIGNGIAGVTAARHIRKNSNKKITIISDESPYFFSRTALMYIYMGHMTFEQTQPYENWFWKKNRIDLKQGFVNKIIPKQKSLLLADGSSLNYDKLIIATGSRTNKFGWPGQDLKGVTGLYHKQDLNYLETHAPNKKVCKRAVIVGGGLIGVELAEMLSTRDIPVSFLVREDGFWRNVLPEGDSRMISQHIKSHGIDLKLNANLKEINSDENGQVRSVVVAETGEEIACNLVGLTTGVTPNITFLEDSEIETNRGVLVNRYLETNIEAVYAIGDCAEQREAIEGRKPVEAVWYTGRMMGETLAQTICGNRIKYNPGPWFNSAKFFDIEYQTYGWVSSNPSDEEMHFHWRHSDNSKCITIAYHKTNKTFLGINTFGIRMRHEVFDRWLKEQRNVDFVMDHLAEANFDPEFYSHFEKDIKNAYLQNYEKVTL